MNAHHVGTRARRTLAAAATVALTSAPLPLGAAPLTGGPYVLVGAPATGGTSQGGGYNLTGYVAAAGADTSSGADFDLTCGLLGIYYGPSGEATLKAALTAGGEVRIWWAAELADYTLESTTTLGPGADWEPAEPAPAGNEYITNPAQPTRFFRLRRP